MIKQKGFTLIELLVVIAIVGLISTIILVSLNQARRKGRDAKRLSDMHQIVLALEMYYDENSQYPGSTSSYGEAEGGCGGWDTSSVDNDSDGRPFIEPLIDAGLMSAVPGDPVDSTSGSCSSRKIYRYYRYGAGSYGCDSSRGAYFVLGVNDMETSSRPHAQSPGWNCPSRNWQNEFDWVTGRFEK